MLAEIRRWLTQFLELLVLFVALLALLQVLFGTDVVAFFGIDVVGNIGAIAQKFGREGLVGVIAAAIVAYLILRERPVNRPMQPHGEGSSAQPLHGPGTGD